MIALFYASITAHQPVPVRHQEMLDAALLMESL